MLRVAIPGGVWRDDTPQAQGLLREIALRPVGGEDEAFLLDTAEQAAPSARATALLARCLLEPDAAMAARALTVGDREALLLHLRRLTIGETCDCVLHCPAEQCGERMELELNVSDLLVPAYPEVRRQYELTVDLGDARYEVSFRLPTAADLERTAALARSDPARGADSLLQQCVVRATRDDEPVSAHMLPAGARDAIGQAMADRDPQAQIELDLACPVCNTAFSVVFDTAEFFLQELDQRAAQLMQDIHTLAWHYHWSERDILQLPRRRRARYLELIAGATARARAR